MEQPYTRSTTDFTRGASTPRTAIEWKETPSLIDRVSSGLQSYNRATENFSERMSLAFIGNIVKAIDSGLEMVLSDPVRAIKVSHKANPLLRSGVSYLPGADRGKEVLDDWKNYFQTEGRQNLPTKTVIQTIQKLEQAEHLQPSREWQNATITEKATTHLPETMLQLGPGVLASVGTFAINPTAGFVSVAGSTMHEVRDDAIAHGVDYERAELLGLSTGMLVSLMARVVPSRVFRGVSKSSTGVIPGPDIAKENFMRGLAKNISKTMLQEGGMEIGQETVQMLAESTYRELGYDEVAERLVMAGIGGVMGGGFMGSVSVFSNANNAQLTMRAMQDANNLRNVGLTIDMEGSPEYQQMLQDARKYKSADEFIKAQGTPETASQLTDIWNKAHGKTTSTEGVLGQKGLITADRISEFQFRAEDGVLAKDTTTITRQEKSLLKDRIKTYAKGVREGTITARTDIKNIQDTVVQYLDAKGASKDAIGRLTKQINKIQTAEQMKNKLPSLLERAADMTTRTEIASAKKTIQTHQKGFRDGTKTTKADVKKVQDAVIKNLKDVGADSKTIGRFTSAIKNIQTEAQMANRMPRILERAVDVIGRQEAKKTAQEIKRELKKTKPIAGKERLDVKTADTFRDVRKLHNLSKKKALAEMNSLQNSIDMSGEPMSNFDKLKMKMLEHKAEGAKNSELMDSLLRDIRAFRKAGEAAKTEADAVKAFNESKLIDEVFDGVKKQKAGGFISGMLDAYSKGLNNLEGLLRNNFGKNVGSRFKPILAENNRNVALHTITNRTINKIHESYDLKSKGQVPKKLSELNDKNIQVRKLTARKGSVGQKINKLEVMDMYLALKNKITKERFYNTYGKEQVDNVITDNLSDSDKMFADWMMAEVQAMYPVLNKRHIEMYGRSLPKIDSYWMAKAISTKKTNETLFDTHKRQVEEASAQKKRTQATTVEPEIKNSLLAFNRYMYEAYHIKWVSPEYESILNVLKNPDIKQEITQKKGEDMYKALINQTEGISLQSQQVKLDTLSNLFDRALNNWVKAKILSPSTWVRQWASVINYAEKMPSGTFTKYASEGLVTPKKTAEFMVNVVGKVEDGNWILTRLNRGGSEAIQDAITGSGKFGLGANKVTQLTTLPLRASDVAPIIYGGYAYYKHQMDLHGNHAKAVEALRIATSESQQDGSIAAKTGWQNRNDPFTKTFTRFKNTPLQYIRKQGDAIIDYRNGDININQLSKTMLIYGVLNPAMYVMGGALTRELFKKAGDIFGAYREEDDEYSLMADTMEQIITNPFQAIPVIDGISEYAYREALNKARESMGLEKGKSGFYGASQPIVDDLYKALSLAFKNEPTFLDYIEMVALLQEPVTGIGASSIIRHINYVKGDEPPGIRFTSPTSKDKGVRGDTGFTRGADTGFTRGADTGFTRGADTGFTRGGEFHFQGR